MPGTRSGYNDPAIGQAFGNLAAAFAPPTAAEQYAAAKTAETKQKIQTLADLYAHANDGVTSRNELDNAAAVAGVYAPSQSFYSVDQGNATSRSNNAADNARAITQTGMTNAKDVTTAMLQPVGEGETRFVPPDLAEYYRTDMRQGGTVKLGEGDTAVAPDGLTYGGQSTLKGTPKPMTSDQLKATIIGQAPATDQHAFAMGDTPVTNVAGPDGKPTIQYRSNSIGQTEAAKPTDLAALEAERDALPANSPKRAEYDAAIAAEGKGKGTTVNIGGENKIEDAYGSAIGKSLGETIDAAKVAPDTRAQTALIRDALSRGGDNITTGPFAQAILKAKQAGGSLMGVTMDGVPEAELINNLGFKLATQAARAISSRPTQFEFSQALATKPGLSLSKPGMNVLLNIMDQDAQANEDLAQLATVPENRKNWVAVQSKYYQDHPIISPFTGKPLDATDIDRLTQAAGPNAAIAPNLETTPAPAAQPNGQVVNYVVKDGKLVPQ